MTPQTNHVLSDGDLLLQSRGFLNNLVLISVSYASNSLENTSQITNVELIMEFSRSREQSLSYGLPEVNSSFDNHALGSDDLLSSLSRVLSGGDNGLENTSIDILDRTDGGGCHVDREEMPHHSRWDTVSSTSRVSHGCYVLNLLVVVKGSSIFRDESVETTLLNDQSDDLKGLLISPVVNFRHGEIIQEAEHFFVTNRPVDSSLMLLDFTLNGHLEVSRSGGTGEVNSLEGLAFVELGTVHQDDRSLGSTSSSHK